MKTYQKSARLNCNFEYEGHYNHNYNCNYTFLSNTPPAAPATSHWPLDFSLVSSRKAGPACPRDPLRADKDFCVRQ